MSTAGIGWRTVDLARRSELALRRTRRRKRQQALVVHIGGLLRYFRDGHTDYQSHKARSKLSRACYTPAACPRSKPSFPSSRRYIPFSSVSCKRLRGEEEYRPNVIEQRHDRRNRSTTHSSRQSSGYCLSYSTPTQCRPTEGSRPQLGSLRRKCSCAGQELQQRILA